MKTNRKLQLLAAATVAMLAINPAARAQTPAPISDEMLLHALATGQVFTDYVFTGLNGGAPASSQLGAGGGDDEKVSHASTTSGQGGAYYFQGQPTASQLGFGGGDDEKRAASASPGTASIIVGGIGIDYAATESYGGGLYLQGGTTASQLGVGGGDDDAIRNGYRDADGDTYGTVASYGGGLYLQGGTTASQIGVGGGNDDSIRNGYIDSDADTYGLISEEFPEWVRSSADQRASNGVYPGLYLQGSPTSAQLGFGGGDDQSLRPDGVSGICDDVDNCIHNGGAIYNATTGSPSVNSTQGGALYRSTASSLYGETLPGDQLTDAHLDAMILDALAGVADTSDNCPVAPMPR